MKGLTKRLARAVTVSAVAIAALMPGGCGGSRPAQGSNANTAPATQPAAQPAATNASATGPPLESMDVNKAVMVTVELDFGGKPPSIAEAIKQIDRRYQPNDGQGRTFAILDAYGEPTPDGKLLHMSMHVSSEKPGLAQLVFRRTGEVLWQARINPTTLAPQPKRLTILIDAGGGRTYTVDGSNNPSSVLEANAKEPGKPVKEIWPDGQEREVTFIYSACGCPVKVMVRRVGDRTVRTKDTPVIFPDDPDAGRVISQLMRW